MMLLRLFCCLLFTLSMNLWAAEAKGGQKPLPKVETEQAADGVEKEDAKVAKDEQSSEEDSVQVEVEAHFLSENSGPGEAVEPILIFQISKGDMAGVLPADKTVLCHNGLEPKQELSLDRLYKITLSKKEDESAVSWSLESAEEIKEPKNEKEPAVQSVNVPVQLLDSGATWLLCCERGAMLEKGEADIILNESDIRIKTEITAFDGRFIIIASPQLSNIPDNLLQQSLIITQ